INEQTKARSLVACSWPQRGNLRWVGGWLPVAVHPPIGGDTNSLYPGIHDRVPRYATSGHIETDVLIVGPWNRKADRVCAAKGRGRTERCDHGVRVGKDDRGHAASREMLPKIRKSTAVTGVFHSHPTRPSGGGQLSSPF